MTDAATEVSPLPWDALSDAFAALEDARRHGDAFDVGLAEADFAAATERLGLVAAALLHAAAGGWGESAVMPATWKRLGDLFGVQLCFDMAKKADRRAKFAEQRAGDALAELDAIRTELNELRRQVADMTPGVGEPRLRVV